MAHFASFCLDKEKDIIIELDRAENALAYRLRTPNHGTGNLITNLARLCSLPLSYDEHGMKIIEGTVPCYVDGQNREVYILHLGETKVANIYPDGTVERKAAIPAIAKTLMSQTKDYRLDFKKTLVKTWILRECKFRTDLHTHMNANLDPDILIALGIHHQLRYPLYYIKKLNLRCTPQQQAALEARRAETAKRFADSPLTGKYLTRRIDDNTFINFADLMLADAENTAYNLPKIRASLAILKDGQAVFTNLEKVYLYRYVFTKGVRADEPYPADSIAAIPDRDVAAALLQMAEDRRNPDYAHFSVLQDKLLWIARGCRSRGIDYMEISDTTLVKPGSAPAMLAELHASLPAIRRETGVTLSFLAAIRRIPLTIVKDQVKLQEGFREQLAAIRAVADDPYVAGSDIIGEEINDIRDLKDVLHELVRIAEANPGFVLRVHAGENDSLHDNVANSLRCVREALAPGQPMPPMRIGHGLYTANLNTRKGQQLMHDLRENGVVLEFQITSNVRLNNLSSLEHHPLKQYLKGGVLCVQGTDGGALYGTDSIDEQLALERMLDLSREELLAMRRAEEQVFAQSMAVFAKKTAAFEARGIRDAAALYTGRIETALQHADREETARPEQDGLALLRDRIRPMPLNKAPVVLLGGSFNSVSHATRMREPLRETVARLAAGADPDKVFFVIGHRLTAYEGELVRQAAGRFEVFAFVPTQLSAAEAGRLRHSGVFIRPSIEPTGMGLYKSFAYEIFKRRPSVVIALDGNSASLNTVQEAKNGKRKARIFISRHARLLSGKAMTLQGYVQTINGAESADAILAAAESVWQESRDGSWFREDQAESAIGNTKNT